MFNKFILALFFFFVTTSVVFGQKTDFRKKFEKYSKIQYKVKLSGDAIFGVNSEIKSRSPNSFKKTSTITRDLGTFTNTISSKNVSYIVTYTPTGATTIYDLVSNGSPQNIFWDPNFPNKINVVCACSPSGDIWGTFPGRRTCSYHSIDQGATFQRTQLYSSQGGFPTVSAYNTSNILITNVMKYNNINHIWSVLCTQSGSPIFNYLIYDGFEYSWPRTVATRNYNNGLLFCTVASKIGSDSCFYTAYLGYFLDPVHTPWTFVNSSQAETYAVARGADGRIGIAYRVNDVLQPADYGSVYYMYSTNDGMSFGTPEKIYDCNFHTDSLGMLRGISMVYIGNNPKVVFETMKQKKDGSYYPNAPGQIRFWSTTLPGSDPYRSIVIADTSHVGWHPSIAGGSTSDVLGTLCRPTIGRSSDQNALFVSFMVPTDFVGGVTDTNSFNSVWLMYSLTGGSSWMPPAKITPESPLRDWTYPSISIDNIYDGNNYYVNMTILSDSMPGTYVNHQGNGESLARQMYVRVQIARNVPLPVAPILSSPANGSTNVTLNPTLDWNNVVLADLYNVQVSLSSSFTIFIVDTTISNRSQYSIPPGLLSTSTQYYWRINAVNSGGTGPWSDVWSFTTSAVAPPFAPNLVSPVNNSIVISLTPLLDWDNSTGASNYTLQVSKDSSFFMIITDITLTPSQYNIPSGILTHSTNYYWRVNAVNASGASVWSNTWIFTTGIAIPSAPVLSSPYNGMTNVPLNPVLDWVDVSTALNYRVQASLNSSFTTTVVDSNNIPVSQINIPLERLVFFTTYYWRVCATNSSGTGPWSPIWNFRTRNVTGINQISATIPTENKLFNNYPNPFNPNTKIRFDIALPENTSSGNPNVKLLIFDMLGREVAVLVNESLMPGIYEYDFNATKYPSGVYFYRLQTEGYTETRKMLLTK